MLRVVAKAESRHRGVGKPAFGKIIGFSAVRKAAFGVGGGQRFPAQAVSGARLSRVAAPVALARKRQSVVRRGEVFVDCQQIEEIIVRAAGKAVYFLPLCVVSHGGIAVEMLWIQAAKALLRVNTPVVEIVNDAGAQVVKGVRHRIASFSCRYYSIRPRGGAIPARSVRYLKISIRGFSVKKENPKKIR